ncbi:MAG TPA: ATP-binding protein, partial [Pirellulales bacterium]
PAAAHSAPSETRDDPRAADAPQSSVVSERSPLEHSSHAMAFDSLESAVVLPLLARGRTLGALALGLRRGDRRFSAADVALAEELAGRAAIALDNARLYSDVQLADRRKNEFLSMLAHELRNPMAPILNGVQVLRMAGFAPPELEQIHDVIERQVHHLVRMVDDLLDISRITSGKIRLQREPVVVAGIVARAVEASRPLMESRRHQLTVVPARVPLRVDADAVRLAQVLTNLLNNAAKYTNEGGRISLTFEREHDEVVFRVRDSGVGIPPDMLASVFELFTQVDQTLDRSQGGLGIGLTLVRNLVEMHGGSVQALSAGQGQGSEFIVRLAAVPDDSPDATDSVEDSPVATVAPRRILVVDDNVDAAATLALLLRGVGHEVRTAKDGLEALTTAAEFEPEVGLLDIGLPGMDGYELARRLRERQNGRAVTLVALTGYGQDRDVERSRDAGFDHHLIKPVDFTRLAEFLRPAEHTADSLSRR